MQKTVVTDFQPGEPDTTRITVPKQGKKVSRNVVSKNPTITTVRGHSEEASSDTTSTSSWFTDAIKTLLGILLWLCAAILGFVAALFVLWVAYLLLRKLYWLLSSSKESYNTDPNKGRSTETKDTTDVVKADSEKTPVASVKPSSEITNSDPSTPTPHAKKGTLLKRVVIRTEETYKDE